MSTIYTPNTGLIRGVQHFYTATKPTTRPNGSALVIGDKWWKTDDGTEWFWNGTYWLSREENWQGYVSGSTNFAGANLVLSTGLSQMRYQFILTRVYWSSNIVTCNSSNYWQVVFGPNTRSSFSTIDNGNNLSFGIKLFEVKQSGYVPMQSSILNIVPVQNENTYITSSVLYLQMVGTPSTARIYVSLFFSNIHP